MKDQDHIRLQNKINRRTFLYLAGISSSAAFLAACSNAVSPTSAPPTAGPAATGISTLAPTAIAPTGAPAAGGGLSFWTPGGSDAFCETFNLIAADYQKTGVSTKVDKAQCYAGNESYNEVLLANVAAGTTPDATILWTTPAVFAARSALEPLDDLMANSKYSQIQNWPAGVLSSTQFKGKVYGLPVTAGSYGIFYNADLLASKGITKREEFPKTWDELRKLSKEFVKWNGDTLETAGYIPWGNLTDPGSAAVELAIWSALNGSQLFDSKNLKYTLDSPQNIEMMQYAVDWWDEQYKGDFVKVTSSGNWAGYPDDQSRAPAFQEGRLAMNTSGFWFTGDLYGVEPKFKKWDAASFPVGPSGNKVVSGYWPNWLVIPKGTKNKQAAFDYLDYIAGEGVKTWFSRIPDMPTDTVVSTETVPQIVVDKMGKEFAQDVTTFFRKQFDVATAMWDSPVQDFGNDQIGRAVQQILSKKATPKAALAEAQKASQAELEKALKS